jgi:hypothetical protein
MSAHADRVDRPMAIDPSALLSAVGFSVACLVSALSGGSSLPLKVDEAVITFGIVAVGCFLILHALIHIALAVSLSTSSYVVASRVVDRGTIALGVLGLGAYRRHVSREQ